MSRTTRVPPAKLARIVEWIRHHLYRLNQRLVPAPAAMLEMIIATWTSQAITVAAELGVADALANGPLRIDELAAQVDADADALRRLLRALIGRGIFRQRRDGRYERVRRPTQSSRVPNDPGGANRFTPQRGGGQNRVTTATGWSGWCVMSSARTPLGADYCPCQRA
jgi:AraC-like DNA-binding protein